MTQNLEFLDEQERELYAAVALKEETLDFLRSPVGRYLHGRAKIDLEAAKEELLDCNPWTWWGRRKIARIQQRADTARCFLKYCTDAIEDGFVAEKTLT